MLALCRRVENDDPVSSSSQPPPGLPPGRSARIPHPVLDDLYDSPDAAWGEAVQWWTEQGLGSLEAIGIGVEVSTASGDWRTLRHPGA